MKVVQHSLFWLLVVLLLTVVFGRGQGSFVEAFYFVSLLLPVAMATSYFFNYYLVPKYLFERKYVRFAIYTVYMIITSLYFEMIIIVVAFIYLANYDYENLLPLGRDVFTLTFILYLIVFVNAFVLLVKSSFLEKDKISSLENDLAKNSTEHLLLKVNRKNIRVSERDILLFESMADYVKVHTQSNGVLITKEKISTFEAKLPHRFIRIHRSFIVNTDKISNFNRNGLSISGVEYPISRKYKSAVIAYLEENKKQSQ